MKPKHIRAFEINRQRFHVTDRGDGALCVTGIHPYDETEYHWAQQASKSCWHIYRNGRRVKTIRERAEITPEQVGHCLMRADHEAKLIPRTAIW